MTENPSSKDVQNWRLNWRAEELRWRTGGQVQWDQGQQERELRRRARSQQDRASFGQGLWGVSPEHRKAGFNPEWLERFHLPLLSTEEDLAGWLGLSLTRLRWFTHDRPAERVWHYVRYTLPKRSGGTRVILAPKRELKRLQRQLLRELLDRLPASDSAQGFVRERSAVTNALGHVGKAFILKMDLKDFFPAITFGRVRGAFIWMGYSFSVASALAMLCTEYERVPFVRGSRVYYISVGPRHLVQGAPTSPAVANFVAFRLDKRLEALARQAGFDYSRYADDLTFSGDSQEALMKIRAATARIIADEQFTLNVAKTRILRQSTQQRVTGVVVNDRLSAPRQLRRQIRAILHRAASTGLAAQNREGRPNFRAYLYGLIGYIHAINPDQAAELGETLAAIAD